MSRTVYGSDHGYCIVEGRADWTPVPRMGDLLLLGTTQELFSALNEFMTQADLAALAGVGQQAVSSYVTGRSEPRLLSRPRAIPTQPLCGTDGGPVRIERRM